MNCIYCLEDSSGSKSEAHIVPEGFLTSDVVLEPGIECDECNQYASQLETALIHHNRIWAPIMMTGARGKGGRRRKHLGHMERTSPDRLTLWARKDHVEEEDGHVSISLPDPPEYDELKFRRGLYHIGLNYVAWKLGHEAALEPRFDDARRYVRRARRGESWPYAQVMFKDDRPRNTLRISRIRDAPGFVVRLMSYIDDFYIDVEGTGRLHHWAAQALPDRVGLL